MLLATRKGKKFYGENEDCYSHFSSNSSNNQAKTSSTEMVSGHDNNKPTSPAAATSVMTRAPQLQPQQQPAHERKARKARSPAAVYMGERVVRSHGRRAGRLFFLLLLLLLGLSVIALFHTILPGRFVITPSLFLNTKRLPLLFPVFYPYTQVAPVHTKLWASGRVRCEGWQRGVHLCPGTG